MLNKDYIWTYIPKKRLKALIYFKDFKQVFECKGVQPNTFGTSITKQKKMTSL